MWGIILALISGALMSIQGVFNTEVTKQTSLWVSTGFVQLTAFFVCVIAWLCTGRENVALLTEVRPWYLLTGGILGAFITITVVQSMGSLGPAQAVIIIVTSQVAVAYLIELFGLFGSIFMEKNPWPFDSNCRDRSFSMGESLNYNSESFSENCKSPLHTDAYFCRMIVSVQQYACRKAG